MFQTGASGAPRTDCCPARPCSSIHGPTSAEWLSQRRSSSRCWRFGRRFARSLSRYLPVHHIVREAPRVVAWNGQLLEDRLQSTNVSADEVGAAVRKAGLRSLSEVQAVVLENGGESSAVARSNTPTNQSAFFGLHVRGRSLGVRIT